MTAQLIASSVLLLAIGYPLYRLVRYGGFRGAIMGARIRGKAGEFPGPQEKFYRAKLVLYRLAGSPGKDLAMEFNIQSGENNLGFVVMSRAEARQFATLLRQAIDSGGPPSARQA